MPENISEDSTLSFEYYNQQLEERDKRIAKLESQVSEMTALFRANFNTTKEVKPQNSEERNKILEQKAKEAFR